MVTVSIRTGVHHSEGHQKPVLDDDETINVINTFCDVFEGFEIFEFFLQLFYIYR